jgi:hypothetical protein
MLVKPDVAVAETDQTITGSLGTNDVVPTGSTYALNATVSTPGGATTTFTVNPDGTFSFVTDTPGIYVYNIEVCAPSTPPGCEIETFTITVTDPAITTNPPVANNDVATTYADANPANPGAPVAINVPSNDRAGNNGGTLDLTSVAIGTAPSNGGTSIDPMTGVITYTPNAGFTGTDSFTYTINDSDGNGPTTATVFIRVYPASTANIVFANDDFTTTGASIPVSGNVLTNDTQLSGAALSMVTTAGTFSNAGEGSLLLNADGTYTFTPVAGFNGSTSFTYTAEGTDGAIASATLHVLVLPPLDFTWLGTTSDWCEPTNWDRGTVPPTSANIIIATTATDPIFDGTCPVCVNNLTIASGASLDLSGNLCITGNMVSDGPVTGTGSIVLQGTTLQTITGEFNINNLELNNASGATITSGLGNMVNMIGELKLSAGLLTTNGNITLKSDETGSAYLAPILTCDGSVGFVGNVRVEVFVRGQNRAFRFFGHFFNHSISLQQMRDVIDITGDGLDFNDTGNPSAFWYNTLGGNQRSDVDAEDVGWVPFTSATLANWQQYQGIRVMVRGPKAQTNSLLDTDYTPDPVTFTWVGELNICNQTINLTHSGNPNRPGGNVSGDSKWNLIANPYPAPLDMGTVAPSDRDRVGSIFYVWEPRRPFATGATGFGPGGGRAGRYRTVPFVSGAIRERTLPIGTAFFLESTDDSTIPAANTNASITFRENYKLSTRTPGYLPPHPRTLLREEEVLSNYGENSMQLLISEGETELDRVIVYFKEESESGKDYWDGDKMANDDLNFFTVSADDWALAVDSRPWEEGKRYPLHLLAPEGTFTLSVPDYAMDAGRQVSIYDRFTEQTYELAKGESFTFQVTDDPASKGYRFEIVMGTEVVTSLDASVNGLQVFLLPNPAVQQVAITVNRTDTNLETQVRVLDMRGVTIHSSSIAKGAEEGRLDYPVQSLPKGVYLVEVQQGKQRVVKKLVVK